MTPIPIMRRLRLPCAPRPGAGKRAPLTRLAAGEDLTGVVADLARTYERAGATAVSVLTERRRFGGSLADLVAFGTGKYPAGHPFTGIIAAPDGPNLFPPLWILSSSGYGSHVAAHLGAGLSFAWHINPDTVQARMAVETYRRNFQPSPDFPEPKVMVAANVICAGTPEEADDLTLPFGLMFLRLRLGTVGQYPSVEEAKAYPYTPQEKAVADAARARVIAGTPEQVAERLREAEAAMPSGTEPRMGPISTVMRVPSPTPSGVITVSG